ncbi:hypothetical protein ES705_17752 [subsurface metagenome]
MSTEGTGAKETGKLRVSWLGYGAEILTIFFALAVLTGRVYAQSYWNVFGLSPELIDTTFINYAIMSPNTVLASMLIAISTVVLATFFRRRPPDIIGSYSPRVLSIIGMLAFVVGLSAFIVLKVDLSTWIPGTVGIVFGFGYLMAIGGLTFWLQALLKGEKKKPSKLDDFLFGWGKKVPFILIQIFFILAFLSVSLWGILSTAQTFGANEAKFMYNTRPIVTLELDSSKGFEDIALVSDPNSAVISNVKIIAETGGFLYIARLTKTPPQLNVRAVPVSRVQAIQYNVVATPIGE